MDRNPGNILLACIVPDMALLATPLTDETF